MYQTGCRIPTQTAMMLTAIYPGFQTSSLDYFNNNIVGLDFTISTLCPTYTGKNIKRGVSLT